MLKTIPLANAFAAATGVFYLACLLLTALAPNFIRSIGNTWIHGYDLSSIPAGSVTAGGFVLGLTSSLVIGWIFGYLLGWFYNKLSK